ncbi:MAG: alcohol dehydrogenase catalytic domain-containing protein [Lentisphaeria bacterium]|jgi:2-desacetyl-2-hydroxyethyl bacteriochlorophyllide A dehydrogenase|nr:alcohol dehydrogenase catalytic domain-containing protein [Lentisphaeria bacterium]
MKALYTAGPGEYGLVERPKPAAAMDEALVRIASAGLCHTDVIIREGRAGHVRYPVIPGHEFAGVIEACGAAVESFTPGDRVVVQTQDACGHCSACAAGDPVGCRDCRERGSSLDGGFAEYCAVPARFLYRLPDSVTNEAGALVEPLANAVSAVRQTHVGPGDQVAIIGPGPIGLLAVQVARLANPSVLVLVGTRDERLAMGESMGATHTVNIKREGARETLRSILGSCGADVAIQCAGTVSALELALEFIGWRGRIGIEGGSEDRLALIPDLMITRAATMIGICGWMITDFVQALELLADGRVKVEPIITHTFPLEEWETAFEMITQRKSESVKVEFAF